MGTIKTTNIEPIANNGTVTLGSSGDTFTVPSGVTVNMSSATQTGVGGANTPYFSVYKSSGQTINHNSTTKVTFSTADTESASGVFDLSNNKFTVVTAGKYNFQYKLQFYDGDNNLKRVDALIYKNGSQDRKDIFFMANGGIREVCLTASFIQNLSASDYLEVYVFTNTTDSGTSSLEGGGDYQTYFSGFKIIT